MSFLGDVWDAVSDPKNLLRWVTLSGWAGYLTELVLPGGTGAVLQNTIFVALPGLVQGESFSDAWVGEVAWRCAQVARFLGQDACSKAYSEGVKRYAGSNMPESVRRGIEKAKRLRAQGIAAKEALKRAGIDVEKLAADCRFANPRDRDTCRADAIAAAINLDMREQIYDLRDFDVATGAYQPPNELTVAQRESLKNVPPLPPGAVQEVAQAYHEWERAIANRQPENVTNELEQRYRTIMQLVMENEILLQPRKPAAGPDPFAFGAPVAGSASFLASSSRSTLGQLLIAAALTSPFWFPVYALPALQRRGLLRFGRR